MLNIAHDQLDGYEKKWVSELNFKAAEKSISLTAIQCALNFVETSIQLLDKDSWQVDYDYTLEYYHFAAKTAFCALNYCKMMSFLNILVKNANSELDTIPSYALQIRVLNQQKRYTEGLQIGLKLLEAFNEKLCVELDVNSLLIENR